MNVRRSALFAAVTIALASCAQTPPPAPPPPPVRVEPPPEPPPPPPPPVTVETRKEAQQIAEKVVIPLLETGKADQARVELDRALVKDPENKLVLSLLRQLKDDPVAWLGTQNFSYVVRAGDSLSTIAAAYLKDRYLFYILARYNNIAVPKQISVGQSIKVPGRAQPAPPPDPRRPAATTPASPPPAADAPEPSPAPAPTPAAPPPPPAPMPGDAAFLAGAAAEKSGDLERALDEFEKARNAGHPAAAARVDAVRAKLVQRVLRDARVARQRQDLDLAIRLYNRVLALDALNASAKIELNECTRLKEKLEERQKGTTPTK